MGTDDQGSDEQEPNEEADSFNADPIDLPHVESETAAVVLNETLVVSDDWNGSPASAAVRWSLLRSSIKTDAFVTVASKHADVHTSVIAADVRVELISDDLYNRLTRGVEIVLHDYEVLAGPAELLRQSAGKALVDEIAGHAITWPLR